MKWIKERLLYIVLIYINLTFILRLIEKSMHIKNFNYGFTSVLFLIGFLIYCFYNCVLRKKIYKFFLTLLIFSVSGAFYLKQAKVVNEVFNDSVLKNIIMLNDLVYNGNITYFYQYEIILAVIIPLLTILILWATFRVMKKFILIVSLAAVVSIWFSNSYVVVKEYLFIYIFISSLTFIMMSYMKRVYQYKNEGVKVSLKFTYILIYGVIVSLIISKITLMLPQEFKGRDSSSFGNYFENKFASEDSAIYKQRYSLSHSGYSDNDKRLGGPISLSYQEVFKVKSDKPYYLKGNVKDFYDGNKWTKSNENYYEKQKSGDMHFIHYGYILIGKENSITIYPDKKFKTNTIFVPNYTFNVSGAAEPLFYDKTPMVLSEKVVTKPYNVNFHEHSEVIDTIENVRDFVEKTWDVNGLSSGRYFLPMEYLLQPMYKDVNALVKDSSSTKYRFLYRNSKDFNVANTYSEYLQVPENISSRTYDLVKEITKNSYTSMEKVLQIKKYLTENYSYDLQVSVVPENQEFLDYFLFQEKKGYCTYFNTAMTIMCRIAGVPARYTEGFKSPSKEDASGLYVVSNADAHAWCEVLLGAYEYSNMWTIADASPTAAEDLERKSEELRRAQEGSGDSGDRGDMDIDMLRKPKNKMEDRDSEEVEVESDIKVLSNGQLRVINVVTAVILFILMRIIKVMKKKSKLVRSKGVIPIYNYYLYRLATVRIVKLEYQGDLEFVEGIVAPELKERMGVLVQGAYEEFYGKHSVMKLNNKEYYEFLEAYLKDYQGTIEYLLNKYLE